MSAPKEAATIMDQGEKGSFRENGLHSWMRFRFRCLSAAVRHRDAHHAGGPRLLTRPPPLNPSKMGRVPDRQAGAYAS
jgi:hypothetical protein